MIINSVKPRQIWDVNGRTLPELLKIIESEEDPQVFKEAVLNCAQGYFVGLIRSKSDVPNPDIWAEQSTALNALLQGMKMTVAAFYRQNQIIPCDEVREAILLYNSVLVKHGITENCRGRHLAGSEEQVRSYVLDVAANLERTVVDLIIPIASGGFEPAVLTADYLGVDVLFPVFFSNAIGNNNKVQVPPHSPQDYPLQQISWKRILIVDDIISSGQTAEKVVQWAKGYNPTTVYFAAVINQTRKA